MRKVTAIRSAIPARARIANLSPDDLASLVNAQKLLGINPVRTDKVSEVRGKIKGGDYNTLDPKLDKAIEGLLDDLAA